MQQQKQLQRQVFFLIFKLVKGIDGCLLNVFVFSEEGNLLSY